MATVDGSLTATHTPLTRLLRRGRASVRERGSTAGRDAGRRAVFGGVDTGRRAFYADALHRAAGGPTAAPAPGRKRLQQRRRHQLAGVSRRCLHRASGGSAATLAATADGSPPTPARGREHFYADTDNGPRTAALRRRPLATGGSDGAVGTRPQALYADARTGLQAAPRPRRPLAAGGLLQRRHRASGRSNGGVGTGQRAGYADARTDPETAPHPHRHRPASSSNRRPHRATGSSNAGVGTDPQAAHTNSGTDPQVSHANTGTHPQAAPRRRRTTGTGAAPWR